MPATYSPLRYPGGKSQLFSYIKSIINYNKYNSYTYVEPFAGGAGLALKLLYKNVVERIVINDYDSAIFAFWYSCLNMPNELKALVNSAELSVEEWDRQKKIYMDSANHSILEIGFATLYLNRTNHSGIITGGVLGGRNQMGTYKIDARFNKQTLCEKIDEIYAHRNTIALFNLDAKEFLRLPILREQKCILYIDPPYVGQGEQLYRNYFVEHDHEELSHQISALTCPWLVTYDACELVRKLYANYRSSKLNVQYSVNIKRNANEFIFFSPEVRIPASIKLISVEE
jgi:DNA adenine methylase